MCIHLNLMIFTKIIRGFISAEYAINILGTVIHPGETKEIQLDLGTGENSTVPIFPAINGSTGQSNFIIEFPQLN